MVEREWIEERRDPAHGGFQDLQMIPGGTADAEDLDLDARLNFSVLDGKLEAFNDHEKTRAKVALAHTLDLLETCGTTAGMKQKLDALASETTRAKGEHARSVEVGSPLFFFESRRRRERRISLVEQVREKQQLVASRIAPGGSNVRSGSLVSSLSRAHARQR